MSRNQEEGSASWIVDLIFSDSPEGARKYYATRLRERYTEPKKRKKLPKQFYTEKRKLPGEKYGGVILSDSESALTYFKNLLLLDDLLKCPNDVLEALGSDSIEASTRAESLRLCSKVRTRRSELKMRMEPLSAVLQASSGWEFAPRDFSPYHDSLEEIEVASNAETKTHVSGSWKAKLAEEVIEIEQSDEWQNGAPDKVAEKAQIYFKMGLYGLAHQQVNAGLEDHPEDPALHFVKAKLLLSESAQLQWKAFSHQTLHLESAPMSGEEEHHAEQVFDHAQSALSKQEKALIELLNCYRYWDKYKLPNWAVKEESLIHDQVFFKIIEMADRCSQRIYEEHNWLKKMPTDVIEPGDSTLSRDIIHFFTTEDFAELHQISLYFPNQFGTLMRYWSLMQRIKPLVYRNSVKKWRKGVEDSYEQKLNDHYSCQWFKLTEVYSIHAEVPWSNPWPELINCASSNVIFNQAMFDAKIPTKVLRDADKVLTEQQADRRLWQRMIYEWRSLSRTLEIQAHNQEKNLQKARRSLHWSKSAFSQIWKTRWLYAEARYRFDAVIRAWPNKPEAKEAFKDLGTLLSKYPEIASAEKTMLTATQSDEFEDYESARDLLGHYTHIFTDTDTSLISRTWGIFSTYHPMSHELSHPLPLERHYAFAEACNKFEGSLYEKALKLLSVD